MTKVSFATAQLSFNLRAIIQTFIFLTKMLRAVSMGHNAMHCKQSRAHFTDLVIHIWNQKSGLLVEIQRFANF